MKILLILLLAVAAVQAFNLRDQAIILQATENPNPSDIVTGNCQDGFHEKILRHITYCDSAFDTDQQSTNCVFEMLHIQGVYYGVENYSTFKAFAGWTGDIPCYALIFNAGSRKHNYLIWSSLD